MTAQSGLGFSGIAAIQIPDQGATDFVLTKLSPENYDYDWLAGGGGGGQVDSVVGGVNITVDAGDPVNPIVNLDAAITGVSVNAVTLSAAGVATDFLDETGAYSVPAGTGITVEEEGVPLATQATTLDFVGASITASGAGSTKTITAVDQVVLDLFLSGLFGTILNLTQSFGASPISVDLAGALGLSSLQTLYTVAPAVPQITVDATEEFTLDASIAGDVFAVRDESDVDLVRVSTTGSEYFGGTSVGNVLNIQGANAAARGTINTHGTVLIDFDWTSDVGFYAMRWLQTIPSSGAGVVGLMQVINTITVDAGTFISSTVDDASTLRWTVAPGFAVQTLFFARPTYRSTTIGIAPSQSFIYAAQAQYYITGAGSVTVGTYRALSFAPIIRVDNAGDEIHITTTTGLIVQPLFNTRNATAVADYGTIRGVHMTNASTILFGLGIGTEIATDWIGLDVDILTGLVVSGGRIAVRSAIVNFASNFLIQNTGGAQSDFGVGNVHVADDTSFSLGNVIATPDAEMQWLPANNALDFSGGRVRVRGAVEYPPINPAALTAGDNDDWDGLLTDSFSASMREWARITGNVTTSTITGIDSTAAEDGDSFTLTNVGAETLLLSNEDTGSLAANRILTTDGNNHVVAENQSVQLRYDDTTSRWRITTPAGAIAPLTGEWQFDDNTVMADPGAGSFRTNNATVGSVTAIAISDETKPGVDAGNILAALASGDQFYIQNKEDASEFLVFDITVNTDNTGWHEFTGTVNASGSNFTDGKEFLVTAIFA
jgi:hypothetical protein